MGRRLGEGSAKSRRTGGCVAFSRGRLGWISSGSSDIAICWRGMGATARGSSGRFVEAIKDGSHVVFAILLLDKIRRRFVNRRKILNHGIAGIK